MSVSSVQGIRRATPPGPGTERAVAWPKRTVHTLASSMQVVLAESHSFPKITAELFFHGGNAVAAPQSPGLAEITAAVVRAGTVKRTSRRIEEDLRRMGASLGTSSGADLSAISVEGLGEFSEGLLELAADLAQNASFPAQEFERERRQYLEGLKIQRTRPDFLAYERFRRVLFGEHPYAFIAPTEAQVEAWRRHELETFYRRNYVPSKALLIVVGDFAAPEMVERLEKIFSGWKAGEAASVPSAEKPAFRGRRVHLVHSPDTVQAEIFMGNHAITRQHPDWRRLVLANSIYGGAFNSRLVRNIREQKGYTYSPRSSVTALREHGYFSVHAAVRNDVVAATLTEIFYEMDRMRSLAVGEEELTDAKNYLSGVFSMGVATQDGLLTQLSTVYLNSLPEDYLETYREKVRALTSEDVLLAAQRHFDSANAQIVVVGDRAQIEEQAALFGEVDSYDAQGHRI